VNGGKTAWDAFGGGSRGLFQGLWHLWVEVLTKPRGEKKLGLGSQCLGSDFNMRHPEKQKNLATIKILKMPP
jgi:hypothetical protein